ncbi:P-loop containing nucleoside triphosphate hydrolase protein, partial [Trematosphaeria pertusa]
PATFQAWVVGILNGGDESWLKPYVESAFFEEFRARMKKRTGFDAQWLVNGYTLYNTGREYLPSILDYIKDAVTSSVTVESTDTVVYTGLIKFASQQTQASSSSSLTLRGQHEMLTQGQDFHPVSGQPGRIFWFNESLFYLETFDSSNQGYEVDGHWISTSSSDYLLVRCFGGSPKPIHELIEHCKRESVGSEKLEITQMRAGRGKEIVERRKRPLFTIDLEPALRAEIAEDAETFFHKSSRNYYEATGTPYRRGYLLSGPPGTGKTSLSNAIASHVLTLSGLLNVIDGVCAKEGRLLIMTTNAPRKLDPALYRAGRADRVFELGYANKVTAELTFKRTFGQDEVRKFTIEAVDRLAKAFRDQFPKNSRISTAKLAEYCNSHRGRPDRAVEAFADFLHKLRTGADAFSYDINDVVADAAEDGDLNVPDEFDRDLLKLSHSDYLE